MKINKNWLFFGIAVVVLAIIVGVLFARTESIPRSSSDNFLSGDGQDANFAFIMQQYEQSKAKFLKAYAAEEAAAQAEMLGKPIPSSASVELEPESAPVPTEPLHLPPAVPDFSLCVETDLGWMCQLLVAPQAPTNQLNSIQVSLVEQWQQDCVAQGGRWSCPDNSCPLQAQRFCDRAVE